jgi:LacI family transcriptional regulator
MLSIPPGADYLHLSPATVSIVLNDSPVVESIPAQTKQRVYAAAKKFRPTNPAQMTSGLNPN